MSAFFERVRAALASKGYEVLRELGSGGMGIVVLAHQMKLDRLVAVKVIRPEVHTVAATERFLVEAKLLANLPHPNIVPIYDADEADGLPYYTMKYLDGEAVAARLQRGPLRPDDVRKLGRDLLEALEFAHTHGVVHSDVKPANVFWDGKRAVLVDFGIATLVQEGSSPAPGVRPGTRGYMAPELLAGAEATAASDLYGAGLVIYEAYTARHWLDVQHGGHGVWTGVPRPEARVLRRALAWKPAERWPDSASFRRALWRTREWRYQRRTIWLTAGGLALGAAVAGVLVRARLNETWPFHSAGALQVLVAPFNDRCAAGGRSGAGLARQLVRDLQGYVDFSVQGPTSPPWFLTRSSVVVRGVVCARGDSLRAEITVATGAGDADPAITAHGDTTHFDAVSDSLAYGIVREIWNRENPFDPVLPIRALPRTAAGLAAWLAAERLLAQGRWGEADRAYEDAEALDSTCWLCAWRHADVDKWLGRRFDERRGARYLSHIDSFPPHYQSVIRASRQPLLQRIETLTRVARQHREFLPAHFMLADELYHRGPLVGRPRQDAMEAFDQVVRLRSDFVPAWEHLVWILAAEGRDSATRAALARLDGSGPARDPFSAELRVLLRVGLTCRFDGREACGRLLDAALPRAADYPDLAAGPRYLMTFNAPWGAIDFGRKFAADADRPALAKSGLIAEIGGYLALGLADSARGTARALRDRFPQAELDVFAGELEGALLLLDPDSTGAPARWAAVVRSLAAHAGSRASTVETRRRAGWMLLLLNRRFGGLADSGRYARLVAGETGRRPLGALLDADAAARQGRPAVALSATDPLTALPADSLGDPFVADPFFRTVLHLLRAGWHEHRDDVASAARELTWYQNNDVFDRPSGPPQAADIDWAFGTLAQWRVALLLDRAGEASACPAYRRVARFWAQGDARFAARADSARARALALGCKETA